MVDIFNGLNEKDFKDVLKISANKIDIIKNYTIEKMAEIVLQPA